MDAETGVQIYHMQNDCPISSLLDTHTFRQQLLRLPFAGFETELWDCTRTACCVEVSCNNDVWS